MSFLSFIFLILLKFFAKIIKIDSVISTVFSGSIKYIISLITISAFCLWLIIVFIIIITILVYEKIILGIILFSKNEIEERNLYNLSAAFHFLKFWEYFCY